MQLGVIGLGTMGGNLARNAARNGATVVLYNRTSSKTDAFMEGYGSEGDFLPTKTIAEFSQNLKGPRAILLMVSAGEAVDATIKELLPHLSKGDVLIDGGNSHYRETEVREGQLKGSGSHFIGMGVSGGESGALLGPSLMPGGSEEGFRTVEPLLTKMAADDGDGGKCIAHLGPGGAGHFVKMVHNGIEYALMQLIAEAYDVLKSIGGYNNEQLAETFEAWNGIPEYKSFLLEITGKIFRKRDGEDYLVDRIKDTAKQKGTGKWTTDAAMSYGVAIPTINAAVDARILSGRERSPDLPRFIDIHDPLPRPQKLRALVTAALELSTISAYQQGFELLKSASDEEKWDLPLAEVARIWKGGCIIRSVLLRWFELAQSGSPSKEEAAKDALLERFRGERQTDWRRVIEMGVSRGVPTPAMAASLAYYDTIRREDLPQNLVQAQRDFFGAHGYQRIDKSGEFHTEWTK
ncbi:MAG: NADP-dependent phosphogluconate dehydrogenase [Candidatus Peregrinibacteria bacterium]|nr:NADP-dependent phosphogluconate dehydrogenase [Candidatus Peregrinibacteria bacterium]